MTTRVLTMNERDTLSTATAIVDLEHVIRLARPDFGGLQEWNRTRDTLTTKALDGLGYSWARGPRGGGPILWRSDRYELRRVRSVLLSDSEFVGHLPGRRTRLDASRATEVHLADTLTGSRTVVLSAHLTAEVQDGSGKYRTDLAHQLRVMRHRREKRRLGRRARHHKRRGRAVFVVADTNFDNMPLGGFVTCWDHRGGGTLGSRAVDIVYANREPRTVSTYATHSDHRAVCAIY